MMSEQQQESVTGWRNDK